MQGTIIDIFGALLFCAGIMLLISFIKRKCRNYIKQGVEK